MSRRFALTLAAAVFVALALASSAQAAFSIQGFEVTYKNENGSAATQAGSHPYSMSTRIDFSTKAGPKSGETLADGSPKDITVNLPAGFVGDPNAVPTCSNADFLTKDMLPPKVNNFPVPHCPDATAVGTLAVLSPGQEKFNAVDEVGAYNLTPPPGAAAKIGFLFLNVPVALLIRVNPQHPNNLIATLENTSDIEPVGRSILTIWGNPGSSAHDGFRGHCTGAMIPVSCPVATSEKPFITLPRACDEPLFTDIAATSWEEPSALPSTATSTSPLETSGCGRLSFGPTITAKPTSLAASSPTGLDFSLDVKDEGLQNPEGLANADVSKAVVTLPQGFSVNPSIAEGLNVCTEADLERESASSAPGAGCPNASKIGTVEVETPLLDENVNGALYQAAPYDNPFHNLISLYIVLKNPTLGISITQPLKVETDPVTGQLTTVAEDLPQLPFSHFKLHFREGTRSPLVTPSACGTYDGAETAPGVHNPSPVRATLYPSSGTSPIETTAAFQISVGPEGGPCPTGGLPPFHPGLIAGTLNNAAGRFSPFNVRMSRTDAEQEITHFSIKLPPGISGKLAGIPYCPDSGIARAAARKGPHG